MTQIKLYSRLLNCAGLSCLLMVLFGCQKPALDAAKAKPDAPAKMTHPVSEADLNQINVLELTEDAFRRLGITTEAVVLRAMPRSRSYGAELMLPSGAAIVVSAPLAGTTGRRARPA